MVVVQIPKENRDFSECIEQLLWVNPTKLVTEFSEACRSDAIVDPCNGDSIFRGERSNISSNCIVWCMCERQLPEKFNKIIVVLSKNKDENDIQQSQQNRLQLDRRLHERPEQNLNQQQKRQPRFQQQRHHQHLMKQDKCQPNYQRQKQHHYEKQIQQNQQHKTQNLLKHQKRQQHQAQQQHKKQGRLQPHRNQQPNTPEKGDE
ncbi:hypothetical protein HELRODRAFT_183687 [Helobdella robusta]|uniref:Uncharacterized protein n=1 Tax=Helobdella robusta TaxID=6412 RepID=T1FK14_HELRO|nr:hypothetical protein HELRODRAFT_183687 [Helobdella robusta]ESO10362.1 hypothetical protein HELRODRAFT_183687 [Helobdella robusta]